MAACCFAGGGSGGTDHSGAIIELKRVESLEMFSRSANDATSILASSWDDAANVLIQLCPVPLCPSAEEVEEGRPTIPETRPLNLSSRAIDDDDEDADDEDTETTRPPSKTAQSTPRQHSMMVLQRTASFSHHPYS